MYVYIYIYIYIYIMLITRKKQSILKNILASAFINYFFMQIISIKLLLMKLLLWGLQ